MNLPEAAFAMLGESHQTERGRGDIARMSSTCAGQIAAATEHVDHVDRNGERRDGGAPEQRLADARGIDNVIETRTAAFWNRE